MVDAGVVSAKYGDLQTLRENIALAKGKLAELAADTMSFTKGAESVAWESDDFTAKFSRVQQNDNWVQRATDALSQTETAIDSCEAGYRSCVSRNAGRFV
jgi:hypothetical protein